MTFFWSYSQVDTLLCETIVRKLSELREFWCFLWIWWIYIADGKLTWNYCTIYSYVFSQVLFEWEIMLCLYVQWLSLFTSHRWDSYHLLITCHKIYHVCSYSPIFTNNLKDKLLPMKCKQQYDVICECSIEHPLKTLLFNFNAKIKEQIPRYEKISTTWMKIK